MCVDIYTYRMCTKRVSTQTLVDTVYYTKTDHGT